MRKFLCTMSEKSCSPHCRWAEITDEGLVDPVGDDPGIPIEDFGYYFYSDIEVMSEQSFEIFCRIIGLHDSGAEVNVENLIRIVIQESI